MTGGRVIGNESPPVMMGSLTVVPDSITMEVMMPNVTLPVPADEELEEEDDILLVSTLLVVPRGRFVLGEEAVLDVIDAGL